MDKQLYILAFIEGLLVMAVELLSVRLIQPHFGNSIYVLTSVLGVTLFSLLIGYYIGGRISSNSNVVRRIPIFISMVSLWLISMPFINYLLVGSLIKTNLIFGSLATTVFLIAIPLCLLGATSPIIIETLAKEDLSAGKSSGNVYSISTLGGVFGTFLIGLFLVPTIGIKFTCLLVASICLLINLFLGFKIIKNIIIPLITLLLLLFGSYATFAFDIRSNYLPIGKELLYSNDNAFGRLEVMQSEGARGILNNSSVQSLSDLNENNSLLGYTHIISTTASLKPVLERNNALVIGMASGNLIKEISNLGYKQIKAVDIDKRTDFIAKEFFHMDNYDYQFVENDGRHYLASNKETYDLIILDVSASEIQPNHLFTIEASQIYYDSLNENGYLIINLIDFTDPEYAHTLEHVSNGLMKIGFQTRLIKEFYSGNPNNVNSLNSVAHEKIILATKNPSNSFNTNLSELSPCCSKYKVCNDIKLNLDNNSFLRKVKTDNFFSDDKPFMEQLSYKRYNLLRTKYNAINNE